MNTTSDIIKDKMLVPSMTWHQTTDNVFITVDLPEINNDSFISSCGWRESENKLHFKSISESGNVCYEFSESLRSPIVTLFETKAIGGKYHINLQKKVEDEWDRVFADANFNKNHVRVNWNAWENFDSNFEDSNSDSIDSVDSDELQEMIKSGVLDDISSSTGSSDEEDFLETPSLQAS